MEEEILQKSLCSKAGQAIIRDIYEAGVIEEAVAMAAVNILKLVNPEKPGPFIEALLHQVCYLHQYHDSTGHATVHLTCPCPDPYGHLIDPGFFPWLEMKEGAFGTTKQNIV